MRSRLSAASRLFSFVVFLTPMSLLLQVGPGLAQTPRVRVYFDAGLQQWTESCQGFGVMDKLYVVAEHFDTGISQLEYSITYPPAVIWLTDLEQSGTTIGQTPIGITHLWEVPIDASGQFVLTEVLILWNCDQCYGSLAVPLCVKAHPGTGYLRARDAEQVDWIFAQGLGATLCPTLCSDCPSPCGSSEPIVCEPIPTVPIGPTTWGAVKEMYQ